MALVTPSGVRSSGAVALTRPAAGQQAVVAAGAGATLQLGFQPDEASTEASGKDLVFRFPDGSSIVVTGFFEGGAEQLPALQLADGTELSGADFLTAFNPDLLATAAGPGGGSAGAGGSGEYADDPGALVNGVDRLGSLGTIYWDRETEVIEDYRGLPAETLAALPPDPASPLDPTLPPVEPVDPVDPVEPERPGGDVSFIVRSADGADGIYEDWRADKHIGDQTINAARLEMDFSGTGTSTVESVTLTGFPVGAQIYIGGTDVAPIIITAEGQAVSLTYDQIVNEGVYVQAPAYDDNDMDLHAEVTLRSADGESATIDADFTVNVDAVADLPVNLDGGIQSVGDAGHAMSAVTETTHEIKDGFDTDTMRVANADGEGHVSVQLTVTATFFDFDGSEAHYFLVEQLPGFSGAYDVVEVDGVSYFRIPVDNATIAAANGSPTITVDLLTPPVSSDDGFSIRTGAMSVDSPSDNDLRTDNNTAVTINDTPYSFSVDVVDSTLTVRAGWTSESMDPVKHGGGIAGYETMNDPADSADAANPGVLEESTSTDMGAPILLELSNPAETIQSVTLTFSAEDAARGTLVYDGPGALTGPAVNADGSVTYVLDGVNSGAVSGLYFKPVTDAADPNYYNDNDVSMSYQVEVSNASGARGAFSGESVIVMDAVADEPSGFTANVKYNGDDALGAAQPGADVPISGAVAFADLADSSEHHYLVLNIPDGWAGALDGALLNLEGVNGVFRGIGGSQLPEYAGMAGSGGYLLVEVHSDGGFSLIGPDGPINDPALTGRITLSAGNDGQFEYTINLQAPSDAELAHLYPSETSGQVYVNAVAVESDPAANNSGDFEYDYSNNLSVINNDASIEVKVEADVITSKLVVRLFTHEDGMPGQYLDTDGNRPSTGVKDTAIEDGYDPLHGFKISIALVDPQAEPGDLPADEIVGLTLTGVPPAEQGTVWYFDGSDWTEITDVAQFNAEHPNAASGDFYFKPAADWSGEVTGFDVRADIKSVASGEVAHGEKPVLQNDDGTLVTDSDGKFVEGADLYVESVADLADAELTVANELGADGKAPGKPTIDLAGDGKAHLDDDGWFHSEHTEQQTYTVNASLNLNFGDLDGSETGTVLIKAVDGVKLFYPADSAAPLEDADGDGFWEIDLGVIDRHDNGKLDIRLEADKDIKGTDLSNLEVRVRTEETEPGDREDHNDEAARLVESTLDVPTMDSTVTVKVGWVYENNDGAQHGGPAGTPSVGDDALGGEFGAVVKVDISTTEGESLVTDSGLNSVNSGSIDFTFNTGAGDFYFNGTLYTATANNDGTSTIRVSYAQANGGLLTFLPSPGYSDADINLSYKMRITDGAEGATFVVNGKTTLVVDAAADLAEVTEAAAAAADDNLSALISVKAAFPDSGDGSENHYILVEARDGWTCEGADTVTVYVDAGGKPVQPIGYDADTNTYSYPDGSITKDFFQIDVTGETPADGVYKVAITPKDGAARADLVDLAVGTKAVEKAEDAADTPGVGSGYEHNDLNNIAIDLVTVDVNVIDSGVVAAKPVAAFEDRSPDAHTGGGVKDVNNITVDIEGDEWLDQSDGKAITISFKFEGTQAEIDALLADGSFTIDDHTTQPGAIVPNADGSYSVSFPASWVADDTKATQVQIRYNPPTDQDNDLTGVTVTLPVTNGDGYTGELSCDPIERLIVDAVADRPTKVAGAVTDYDGGEKEADWGSAITVKVESAFHDTSDGTEKHYLLMEARDGWTCVNPAADGVVRVTLYFDARGDLLYPNADTGAYGDKGTPKTFWAKEVNGDGGQSFEFALKAPDADSTLAGKADMDAIKGDGSITLASGGFSIEGAVNADGTLDVAAGRNGSESRYDNNISFVNKPVTVDFNVINDDRDSGVTGGAYEDHEPGKNTGDFADMAGDGKITISLNDPNTPDADVIVKGGANTITFTYKGDGAPGSFTYTDSEGTHTIHAAGPDANGLYTLNIPGGAISADGVSVTLTYNPPAFDNTDLTDMGYSLDVASASSKAAGTVTGGINTGAAATGKETLIVDAVADKPATADIDASDVDYGQMVVGDNNTDNVTLADKTAAAPGDTVKVAVSVTFRDIEEDGEAHYIAINTKGWAKDSVGLDGFKDFAGFDATDIIPGSQVSGLTNGGNYTLLCVDDILDKAFGGYSEGGQLPQSVDVGNGFTVIFKADPNHPGELMAEVQATVTVRVPDTVTGANANGGSTIKLEVGGVAVDRDETSPDGLNLRTDNDVASDFKTEDIKVQQIGSKPTVSIGDGQVYENLTPDAHLGKYDTDGPARININDIKAGESAEVTLYFSLSNADPNFGDMEGAKVVYGGVEYDIVANPAGGWMTATPVPVKGLDNAALEFHPGVNSHNDIKVDYSITVTDDATGESKTWASNSKYAETGDTVTGQNDLEVVVDAVAQKPELVRNEQGNDLTLSYGGKDDKGTDDPADDEFSTYVERGQNIFIDAVLKFQDVEDGSQQHFVLVERKPDSMFEPKSVTLTWTDAEGETHSATLSGADLKYAPQAYGEGAEVGMYYKIDVSKILQEMGEEAAGNVKVTFELNSYSDSRDATLRVGAAAYERYEVVQGAEDELRTDNNVAFVVSDPIAIKFAGKPGLSIGGEEHWVSEADTPAANVGDYKHEGGVKLPIILSDGVGGDDAELTGLTIVNWDEMNDYGTLYYLDGDGVCHEVPDTGVIPTGNGVTALVFAPDGRMVDTEFVPDIKYSGTVRSDATGQDNAVGGEIKILVDAVAQQPEVDGVLVWSDDTDSYVSFDANGVDMEHGTKESDGSETRMLQMQITGSFPDSDDSEAHYALVTNVANTSLKYLGADGVWQDCTETIFYNGVEYYKVPMPEDAASVEVQLSFTSRKLALDHNSDTVNFLVMTEEQVQDGGNRENNYNNNIAFSDNGPDLTINHGWPGGDIIWIDPGTENNTPNADEDKDPDKDGNTHEDAGSQDNTLDGADGGRIHFGPEVGSFEFDVPEGAPFAIYVENDGSFTKVPSDGGKVVIENDGREYYFKPSPDYGNEDNFNHSDEDINLGFGYVAKDDDGTVTGGGTFSVVIDAVAQLPDSVVTHVDYDNKATVGVEETAAGAKDGHGNDGLVTITVTGDFDDTDGSERHYALLEKKPGYTITDENGGPLAGVETVYLPTGEGGSLEAYYRVPMVPGRSSLDVTLRVDVFTDENREFTIDKTGVMVEEKGYGKGNLESDTRNNTSWLINDEATVIEYSPVDTSVSISVENTWENDGYVNGVQEHTGGRINIDVTLDEHDKLDGLKLEVPAGARIVDGEGNTVAVTDNTIDLEALLQARGVNIAEATEAQINAALDKLGLRYVREGYDDKDVDASGFRVVAQASDSRSGDVDADISGAAGNMIVDAVAHAPELVGTGVSGGIAGSTAAGADKEGAEASLKAAVELKFEDVGTGEEHYAILGQGLDWPCTGVEYSADGGLTWQDGAVQTFFDKQGQPYYALKIEDGMLKDDGSIKVVFTVDAPAGDSDVSLEAKIGGVSLEPNMGSHSNPNDRETDLLNNWAENAETVTLAKGLVQATGAALTMNNPTEDLPEQMTFSLTGGNNDSIKSVTITGLTEGEGKILLKVGDSYVEVAREGDGSYILDGARAASGAYHYQSAADKHGPVSFTYTVTAQDDASLETKDMKPGSKNVNVIADADKPDVPEGISVDDDSITYSYKGESYDNAANGGMVTFQVSATFGDYTDGSEKHYILVEAKTGWTCPSAGTEKIDGVTYYKIPVPDNTIQDGRGVTVTLKPTSAVEGEHVFKVGAMAQDANGDKELVYQGETVTLDVVLAQSTADDITIGAGAVTEDLADGLHGSQLTFKLENLDLHGDEAITRISAVNLQGGKIVDAAGKAVTVLDPATALEGGYYYVPAANKNGDVELKFNVTVTDNASGHSKTITDSLRFVHITPDTDTPTDPTGGMDSVAITNQHTATTTVTLSADFKDYVDNSEQHFFLVKLPAGASLTGAVPASADMAAAAGMDGTVYLVSVTSGKSAKLNLTLSSEYEAADIVYKAGSYETKPDGGVLDYQFSPAGSYTVNADGDAFNHEPTPLSSPTSSLNYLRGLTSVEGDVNWKDQDGDAVTITGAQFGGVQGTLENGFITVEGKYGSLSINTATGEYTYTLTGTVTAAATERFSVTGTDNYSAAEGGALSGNATITINLTNTNTAPTASVSYGKDLGVNETDVDYKIATGTIALSDSDGDAVSFTSISGSGGAGTLANGVITVEGKYGVLKVDAATGEYKYTLNADTTADAKESFTIAYQDEYGQAGKPVTLSIDVHDINHAPVANDAHEYYDDASAHGITGQLTFSDPDKDALTLTHINVNGTEYAVNADTWANGIVTAEFTLKVSEDGWYMFTPKSGLADGAEHSFTYTVSDGGLSQTGELTFTKDGGAESGSKLLAEAPAASGSTFQAEALAEADAASAVPESAAAAQSAASVERGSTFLAEALAEDDPASAVPESGNSILNDTGALLHYDNLAGEAAGSDGASVSDASAAAGLVGVDSADTIAALSNFLNGGGNADLLSAPEAMDAFRWTLDDLPDNGQTVTDVIKDFDCTLDAIHLDLQGLDTDALRAEVTDGKMQISFDVNGGTQNILLDNYAVDTQQAADQLLQQMIEHNIKTSSGG